MSAITCLWLAGITEQRGLTEGDVGQISPLSYRMYELLSTMIGSVGGKMKSILDILSWKHL